MQKPVVVAAAALIAVASLSSSGAHAGDRGGAIAAGVIGGLAVGALAGAAIANTHRAPAYIYEGYPVYRPAARVYRYYETPYYSGSGYYGYSSGYYGYGYSSGYRDGYNDAAWGW